MEDNFLVKMSIALKNLQQDIADHSDLEDPQALEFLKLAMTSMEMASHYFLLAHYTHTRFLADRQLGKR